MKALIKKLVEAWGPSGFEHHVRTLIEDEIKDLCDEMRVDSMGNLICRVGEKTDDNLRIMIAAHMDEIGLMVSHVDRQGYLRFTNIGGLFPANLSGNRVKFENGVVGVIGMENPWSRPKEIPGLDGFFIDVSDATEDDQNRNADIKVGDPAAFWRAFEERGNRLVAKSMDDRIGCAVAIETMRRLKDSGAKHEIYFVFTVQEEVGLRGARPAAYGLEPDFGIALDVTGTGDTPKGMKMSIDLGKGAAIKLRDNGLIVPPAVKDLMIDTAEKYDIPYQLEILSGGSTDAAGIQSARAGVPSGCISIPCRYVHTVSETVDITDVEACVSLLEKILSNPIENIRPN
ncbi:MAG: M42 family metallopeptidase [Chloroflexi bacterium]|nr:M42 family metallopeptidase [Chloroflexota bacterium]